MFHVSNMLRQFPFYPPYKSPFPASLRNHYVVRSQLRPLRASITIPCFWPSLNWRCTLPLSPLAHLSSSPPLRSELELTPPGFIILGTIDVLKNRGIAYFACFLLCIGSNTPSVMLSTWYSNNTISENQRVVLTGVMVGIANAAGLISGNIFQAKDEPKYIPALAASAAFGGATAVGAFTFGMYMRYENRRRNRVQGLGRGHGSKDVPTALLSKGPKDEAFRYFY